jgi:tellurite resistance protein TerC
MPILFPMSEYWWLYAAFTGAVLVLLGLDLGVFHREAREVRFREALWWCAIWVSLAVLFNAFLYGYARWAFARDPRLTAIPGFDAEAAAWQVALEFLTGYLVEYSLSVDNIFVFILVLGYFGVPPRYQHRVLFYGILGALVCRAVFIALGAVLMQFHWVVWVFGLFLIFTGVKTAVASEEAVEPQRNVLIRIVRRILPVRPELHDQRFLVRMDGRWWATPLLVALLCLEASDIVFAIDSVPAIFALTDEPFVVFTSNVFAILGLRSMYFMLGGVVGRFHLLRYGLAVVLVFVGLKMVWLDAWFGGKFPIGLSLGIIASVLGGSVLLSWLLPSERGAGATWASASRRDGRRGGG